MNVKQTSLIGDADGWCVDIVDIVCFSGRWLSSQTPVPLYLFFSTFLVSIVYLSVVS